MKTILGLILALILSSSLPATAQLNSDSPQELSTMVINEGLQEIEAALKDEATLIEKLDPYLTDITEYTAWLKKCITESEKNIREADSQLEELGGAVLDQAADTKTIRERLLNSKSGAQESRSKCKVLLVRNASASHAVSNFRKKNLQQQSFAKGKDTITVLGETLTESHSWILNLPKVAFSKQGIQALDNSEKLMLASLIALAVILGYIIRNGLQRWKEASLHRWQRAALDELDTGLRTIAAGAMTIRRYTYPLLISIFVSVFVLIETRAVVPTPLLTIIANSLPFLISVFTLTYFVYRALLIVGLRSDLDQTTAHSLRIRFNILAIIWFLGYLLTQTILANSFSEAALFLARSILGLALVLNIIWIIWHSNRRQDFRLNRTIATISSLVLIAALIAEFTGYRNFSGYALTGIVGTLIVIPLFQLAGNLINRLLNDLDSGKSNWQQRLRNLIGVGPGDSFPGFIWIKLIAFITVWGGLIAALLWIWRVPAAEIQALATKITLGFTVGSVEVVPGKIFEAIIVLVLLLSGNGWFQRVLEKNWLTAAKVERGARESIATISNYIGIAIAIVIALAVAGLDFSRLALIAGALSVGIGFGLQNIVNNFVSGLILLFERPVKTGDWIVANGVEGKVKRISIRTTEIESFDRADIIVPNSLLISDNLTNWVRKNHTGRLRIPVSVAYGSDTERVKSLLIDITSGNHAVVYGDQNMHDPKVLFLAFGESSLDFELRFFVLDIENRLDIISDINFAIDKSFREHGIEIPFPQRDLHIRTAETDKVLSPLRTPDQADNIDT